MTIINNGPMKPATAFTREILSRQGFVGFARFLDLDLGTVPEGPGVYVLLREKDRRPQFLERSQGGHFKQKDPTVDPQILTARWIDGAHCVYIGKASVSGSTNLRRRLRDFRAFGMGRPVGHWGCRYVWQVADCADYLAGWSSVPQGVDPRVVERGLIQEFESIHGRRPFANIAG